MTETTQINLSEQQKKELKDIIETEGYEAKEAEENAKKDLTELSKSVKELFGVEHKDFKKMVKLHWKSCYDEEKAKGEYFNELYEEVMK